VAGDVGVDMNTIILLVVLGLAGCSAHDNEVYFENKPPVQLNGGGISEGYIESVISKEQHDPRLNIEVITINSNSATISFPRSGDILHATEGHSFTNGLDLLQVDFLKQQIKIRATVCF
jgi:hypothetical protein